MMLAALAAITAASPCWAGSPADRSSAHNAEGVGFEPTMGFTP